MSDNATTTIGRDTPEHYSNCPAINTTLFVFNNAQLCSSLIVVRRSFS